MNIAIDLRGLNYHVFTGVGNYTMALLRHLPPRHRYTFLGLDNDKHASIKEWVSGYLQHFTFISMSEYYQSSLYNNSKVATGLALFRSVFGLYNSRCLQFDYLILPQPKAITYHPHTKLITVIHDVFGVLHTEFITWKQQIVENKRLYRSFVKGSYRLVVNSHATGRDLVRFFGADSNVISLIYPGDLGTKEKDLEPLIETPYFLAISGIEPRKNWLTMIEAFKKFSSSHANYSLVLIGKQVRGDYLRQVQQKIIGFPNIILITDADDEVKNRYLAFTHALVYPSFYEGFGFPILESMRYDVPVITSKISSMPEIGGEAALLVNPFNDTEIANAMRILVDDNEYFTSLKQSCKHNYARFSWKEFESSWSKILR